MKMYKIIDIFKNLSSGEKLLPTNTGFTWWENVYTSNSAVYDREFTRRYSDFLYDDFLGGDIDETENNFRADVLSILTINQKKYAEMYRVFIVTDEDMPITYNYDMTETTGAQRTTNTKGSQTNNYGTHTDTIGGTTDSHNVAPFNSNTYQADSQDVTTSRQDTYGAREDTEGQRVDVSATDSFTLSRKGNIGVMTSSQIAEHLTDYFGEKFKFMLMIYEDICKELLLIGG